MLEQQPGDRSTQIVKVSIVGIVANVLLATFKAIIGVLSNSIAIVLDAVNNLSDVLSSAITIAGTKLAYKSPNRKHPYGYGRLEYLSTVAIAVIILTAGVTSLKESIVRIIYPAVPDYGTTSLIIVAIAVIVKVLLGTFYKKRGKSLDSSSLIASGQDALMDSILSLSTLVAALISLFFGVNLEAPLGVVISLFILKAGYDIIKASTAKLLGERVDGRLSRSIKDTINSVEGVYGTCDLVLNDYGPQRMWGSVHIEIDEDLHASQIDALTRHIQNLVLTRHQVVLHTIGVFSYNTDEAVSNLRREIYTFIGKRLEILETHGFYLNPLTQEIRLDLVISFDVGDPHALRRIIIAELEQEYPDYRFSLTVDSDICD